MSIKQNTQDADGSHSSGTNEDSAKPQSTYAVKRRTKFGVLLGEIVPLLAIVTLPFSVHAGVFTSLIEMLKEDTVFLEEHISTLPASEVPLLSATTNVDPTGAHGGGDLLVEEGALVSSGSLGEDEVLNQKAFTGEISVYVVREGDTLSQIAQMFEVTSNTILWSNDIKNGVIQPGQSLVILPIVGVRHIVKGGDTISTIAKKYEADIDEILEYNQLASLDELSVGETLVIPGGEIATPVHRVASAKSSGGGGSSVGFIHPTPGAVRTQGIHGYNAVDLAGSYGATIRAAAAGQVIVSKAGGWNGGYGNYVVIRHNDGTQTLYAHMSKNSVSGGAYVAAGQTVGTMGSTGRSTGVHLHFEVRGARNPF